MQPKEKEHLAGLEQRRWSDRKEGMESAWESTARHQARNGREASLGKRGGELQRGFREGLAFIGHSWKWKRCGNKDLPTSEVESEIFHPGGHKNWSWAGPKLGVRGFFQVSHMDTESQGLKPSSAALPGYK